MQLNAKLQTIYYSAITKERIVFVKSQNNCTFASNYHNALDCYPSAYVTT